MLGSVGKNPFLSDVSLIQFKVGKLLQWYLLFHDNSLTDVCTFSVTAAVVCNVHQLKCKLCICETVETDVVEHNTH